MVIRPLTADDVTAVEEVCRDDATAVWVADRQDRVVGFAVDRLREAGVVLVVVGTGVDPGHAPARATYERAGFTAFPRIQYCKRLDR